jgi:hypothetical protein
MLAENSSFRANDFLKHMILHLNDLISLPSQFGTITVYCNWPEGKSHF